MKTYRVCVTTIHQANMPGKTISERVEELLEHHNAHLLVVVLLVIDILLVVASIALEVRIESFPTVPLIQPQ